jgi:hypothetical protein
MFYPLLAPNRRTSKMTVKKDESFKVFAGLTGMDTKFSFGQSQPCQMISRPIKQGSSALHVTRKRSLSFTVTRRRGLSFTGARRLGSGKIDLKTQCLNSYGYGFHLPQSRTRHLSPSLSSLLIGHETLSCQPSRGERPPLPPSLSASQHPHPRARDNAASIEEVRS